MKLTITADRISEVITTCYKAGITPLFIGPPGIGKTDVTMASADELAAEYSEPVFVRFMHLAGMAETDVRGYLIPTEVAPAFPPAGWTQHPNNPGYYYDTTGTVIDEAVLRARQPAEKHAVFTKPEFWATVEKHKRGILFLDEFLQATPEVQKAVAPLILDRRIGEYVLPDGWQIVAAGNGMDDGAGANAMLSHITNRVCVINVKAPEVDSWMAWAGAHDVPFELIAFAKLRPAQVFDTSIPDEANEPYCTPRSLVRAGELSKSYPGGLRAMVDDGVGRAMLAGMIGSGPASELAAVVTMALNLPSFEDVVRDPMAARVPSGKNEMDKAYAMLIMVATRATAETAGAVATYLSRFDPNFALTGYITMIRRDTKLLSCPEITAWIMANREQLQRFNKFILSAINR